MLNSAKTYFIPDHTVIRIKKDESGVPQVYITIHQLTQEIVRYFVNRCLQFRNLQTIRRTWLLIERRFFLKQQHSSYCLLEDCRKLFVDMVPEVRRMFPQVEKILLLLLLSQLVLAKPKAHYTVCIMSFMSIMSPYLVLLILLR